MFHYKPCFSSLQTNHSYTISSLILIIFQIPYSPFSNLLNHFIKIHLHIASFLFTPHTIFHSLLLGFCVIMEVESSPERKIHHKGGKIPRYEPSNCNSINSYSFIKQFFEDVYYLEFYRGVSEVGFHEQLTDWVATQLKGETAVIAGVEFIFLVTSISLAIGLLDNGKYWFKGISLDLEHYKPFLKTSYRVLTSTCQLPIAIHPLFAKWIALDRRVRAIRLSSSA